MCDDKKEKTGVRPIFIKLLIAAIVIYLIGSCFIHVGLYHRLGKIEHEMVHATGAHH
ncbi:hypothetical protein OAA99_01270 [Omnitrophica bacterium]|nr:hypothetical protein [Candidatus Omnitrophota bacterium]